jgi:hypothetical protein
MTKPGSHRERAEQAFQAASEAEKAAKQDAYAPTYAVRLAEAHSHLLRAIYHELRHGHDRQSRQIGAMTDLMEAIDNLRVNLPGV